MIIAETIVLFSVATAAAADRGTELRLPAPGAVRAAQSAPAAAAEDSVAIIAFSNISAVTEDDWIGMGIAEALTAELGRAGDLSVVGRQAVSGTAGFAAVPTTVIDGPPPPPADVPALDENRDAATPRSVRERLARATSGESRVRELPRADGPAWVRARKLRRHRQVATTDHGVPLDTSATLPDGTVFDGPAELRARLRSRREAFVRTVTSKLLTYALGRGVEHYDQPTIRRIVREAGPDHPWSSIVLGIVRSVPFTMRRSEP